MLGCGGMHVSTLEPLNKVAVCELSTTDSNVLGLERVLFRGEPFLRQEERFIHNVVWSRQAGRLFPPRSDRTYKDSLLGSNPQQTGEPVVPGTNQGPRGFAAKASWLHRVVGPWEAFGRNETQATGSCGPARQGGCTHLSGPRQQGLLLRERPDSEQGDPWVPGTKPGAMGFLGKGVLAVPGLWSCWGTTSDTKARAEHVPSTDVAVLPGGALLPAPSGPHQQGPPPWERPGQQTGTHGFLAVRRNPPGFRLISSPSIH